MVFSCLEIQAIISPFRIARSIDIKKDDDKIN